MNVKITDIIFICWFIKIFLFGELYYNYIIIISLIIYLWKYHAYRNIIKIIQLLVLESWNLGDSVCIFDIGYLGWLEFCGESVRAGCWRWVTWLEYICSWWSKWSIHKFDKCISRKVQSNKMNRSNKIINNWQQICYQPLRKQMPIFTFIS